MFFLLFSNIYSANQTVGSDSSSAPVISYLQFDGTGNKIANYAFMNNGFSLQDSTTTCSYYSNYTSSGGVFLIGGKLFLNRDLNLTSQHIFGGGGQIFGNNYSLNFFNPYQNVKFFRGKFGTFNLLDSYDTDDNVWSIDWSYDDAYIATGSDQNLADELRIFGFDGASLTSLYSVNFGDDVNTVRWHPNSNVLAIGVQGVAGPDCFVYSWDGSSLTLLDSVYGGNIRAVDWSKDGNYLAVGEGDDDVKIYSWNGLSLSLIDTYRITGNRVAIDRNSLEWNSNGTYIAVAIRDDDGDTLRVLEFDGINLTQDVKYNIGSRGENVSWKLDSDIIAVGLSGSAERLRLFRHSQGVLTEITEARVGEAYSVFDVNWSHDGNYLAVGRDDQTGHDFFNYYFNHYNNQLLLIASLESIGDVASVRWSHDDQYLARGANNDFAYVYGFNKDDLYFYDTNLSFNSNLNIKIPIYFSNCTLNANGNRIVLDDGGFINVMQGSTLIIKNGEIFGLSKQNLKCLSDSSRLVFQNCKLTLTSDYLFDTGSILFSSDVVVSGTNYFTYSSKITSSIDSASRLLFSHGMTFSYAPKNSNRDLIYMVDDSSELFFDGTTVKSTETGLRLTRGKLILNNGVTFSTLGASSSESISLGNGIESGDLNVQLLSSVNLNIYGSFEYNNIN